jgi:predicted type IV restriction endonuclease
MATETQLKNLKDKIASYKKRYLRKEFSQLDESATRLMTNNFLTEILGYKELEEIKTEYRVRSEYADYVIQLKRKKHFVVEVKSIDLDLNERHLRQSLSYAANEGIDWILLLNGREIQLFRVNFGKPITTTLIYKLDLLNKDDFKKCPELLWYLSKKAVEKGELEDFWKRTNALTPTNLSKLLYSEDIVRKLRNSLKEQTGIYFQVEDVTASLYQVIVEKVNFPKPKLKIKKTAPKPRAIVDDIVDPR